MVRRLMLGGIAGAVVVLVAVAARGGLVRADRPTNVLDRPSPSMCMARSAGYGAEVHGWPDRSRNRAGIYSWDASPDPDASVGFMHNGYSPGSGDVEIVVGGFPGQLIPHRGTTTVIVAGCPATYQRFSAELRGRDGLLERWMLDIQGTTVTITLTAPGAPQSEVAEAHEIIRSLRAEPQDNDLGFRLRFTLTTDSWDSG